MLPERQLGLEAEAAVRAVVGPLPAVLATVCDEVGALAEGLATHTAYMGLFTWRRRNNSVFVDAA